MAVLTVMHRQATRDFQAHTAYIAELEQVRDVLVASSADADRLQAMVEVSAVLGPVNTVSELFPLHCDAAVVSSGCPCAGEPIHRGCVPA